MTKVKKKYENFGKTEILQKQNRRCTSSISKEECLKVLLKFIEFRRSYG
jgi:hypothetical protein